MIQGTKESAPLIIIEVSPALISGPSANVVVFVPLPATCTSRRLKTIEYVHAPPTHVFLRHLSVCDSLRRAELRLVDILFHRLPCNLDCFSPLRDVVGVDPTGERVGHFTLGAVLGMFSLAWVSPGYVI